MTKGRAKLAEMGLQPIGLDLDEASAYVGLTPRSFQEAVSAGIYPQPMKLKTRKKVWNRIALEAALGAQRAEHDPIMQEIDRALRAKG